MGSHKVSVETMRASNTAKLRLAFAVCLIAMAALVASPARVARFDFFNANTLLTGDVANLREQQSERPTVMDDALLLSYANPVSDAFQIFYCDSRSVDFDSLSHDAVCDVPQFPIHSAGLFARQPFQQSPLRASAFVPFRFGLERTPLLESASPQLANASTFENFACADCRNLLDARVNPDCVAAGRIGDFFVSDKAEIPVSFLLNERGGAGNLPTAIKVLLMVIAKYQTGFDTPALRGERGLAFGNPESQGASVKANTCRFFPVMRFLRLRLAFVGFGNNGAGRANEIRRQASQLAHSLVCEMVQRDGIFDALLKGNGGSLVQRFHVSSASHVKGGRVFALDFQFNFERHGGLHRADYNTNSPICNSVPPLPHRAAADGANFLRHINEAVSICEA